VNLPGRDARSWRQKLTLASIGERLAALPGLEDTLKRYRDAGVGERLQEQSLLVREERVLDTARERIASARDMLASLCAGPEDLISPSLAKAPSVSYPPGRCWRSWSPPSKHSTMLWWPRQRPLRAEAEAVEGVVADARTQWRIRQAEVMAAYEQILRDLQRDRVDGDEVSSGYGAVSKNSSRSVIASS